MRERETRGEKKRRVPRRIKNLPCPTRFSLPVVINTRRLLHMDEKAGLGQDTEYETTLYETEPDENETGSREANSHRLKASRVRSFRFILESSAVMEGTIRTRSNGGRTDGRGLLVRKTNSTGIK